MNNSNNERVSLTGENGLIKLVQNICEHAKPGIAEQLEVFFNSEIVQDVISFGEVIDESLEKGLKLYRCFKFVASIPDKLYLSKLDRFLRGLVDIPIEKRNAYVERVSKERRNKDCVYILELINRIEDYEKIDVLLKLFELRMQDEFSDYDFRRMMLMTASTMKEDLDYMVEHINDESFKITCIQEQGLLIEGWIMESSLTVILEDEEGNYYNYTPNAKRYCHLVGDVVMHSHFRESGY